MNYMANNSRNAITISRRAVEKKGGLVILTLKEYRKLMEKAVPAYYLSGKEADELDKLVEEGLKEYRAGKTIRAPSLTGALKIYERKRRKN